MIKNKTQIKIGVVAILIAVGGTMSIGSSSKPTIKHTQVECSIADFMHGGSLNMNACKNKR